MNEYVTFKRTALLMLMFITAWCLPVKGQWSQTQGNYTLTGNILGKNYMMFTTDPTTGEGDGLSLEITEGLTLHESYLLFKLKDPGQIDKYLIEVKDIEESIDGEGKLWMPLSRADVYGNVYSFGNVFRSVAGASLGDVIEYTISLHSTMDESNPLATFTGSVEVVNPVEIVSSVKKIRGEVDQDIAFTVTVKGGETFTGRENFVLRIVNMRNAHCILESMDGKSLHTQGGNEWWTEITRLDAETTYSYKIRATNEINGDLSISLREMATEEVEEIELPNSLNIPLQIPYIVSDQDIAGLQAIADANSSQVLKDYVANKSWLTQGEENRNDSVYTEWDEGNMPARLKVLNLNDLGDGLTQLDVTSLDALQSLNIQNCDVASLDLTSLGRLNSLSIYNTKIDSYSDVQFAQNSNVSVWGRMKTKDIGTPVAGQEDFLCEIQAGDTVDLSEYAAQEGVKFTWYENSYPRHEITLESISPGVFVLPSLINNNVTYSCEISTTKYPDWIYETKNIRLTRGAIDYSQDDLNLLKALAAANPDCVELQQFITAEGWTETWADYWQDQNRKVAVDWNNEVPARISKLRVSNLNTVKSFDISGFTELEYLDCEQLSLEQLLLSGNTKLQTLMAGYNNNIPTLDLSKNTNLHTLDIPGCRTLSRLDLSKCNSLTYLDISMCSGLSEVDLTGVPLTTLRINYTSGLENLVKNPPATVQSLYYAGTDYPALDLSEYPSLVGYGVPRHVTELDITNTNIRDLGVDDSGLKYSTLKAKDGIYVGGRTLYPVPGLVKNEYDEYVIQNGDTIDLSSEAMIGGVASVYTWVKTEDRVEANDAFRQVEGKPGVFVANGALGKSYFCIIANEKYVREGWTINSWSGWRLETDWMRIQLPAATYDTAEVAALKAIVDDCNSPSLKAWWDSEAWKNGNYPDDWRFSAWWHLNLETNTYHLSELNLNNLQDTLSTLNVSAFKELVFLSCENSGLETLSVQENDFLRSLYCQFGLKLTTITLPTTKINLENLQCDYCPQLTTLDIAGYTNLKVLSVRSNKIQSLDVSSLTNLEYLWCNRSDVTVSINNHKKLRGYGVPTGTTTLDLNSLDSLRILDPSGSKLKFSAVTLKAGQLMSEQCTAYTNLLVGGEFRSYTDATGATIYLIPAGQPIDLSAEMLIGERMSTVKWTGYDRETGAQKAVQATNKDGKFTVSGRAKDRFQAVITNQTFPGWTMLADFEFYTRDGDANLDDKVDVRDIAVTANYIVKSEDMLPEGSFGFHEADVNYDKSVNATDIQGIVNLILGKEVTKSQDLRAAYIPTVELSVENGILYMESEVAVAAVQLELTGMTKAEALLGKAAAFTQASTVGDTTRILGYSLKEVTVPAGKSALMRFPAGARLAKAVFSDEKAQSQNVRTKGDIATSNEAIRMPGSSKEINYYPNPFRGTTTLVYRLDEAVDNAFIQVYALNGSLVDVVRGLYTEAGENRFVYSTRLTGGTYIYRLVTQKGGCTNYSKSNTFIIK